MIWVKVIVVVRDVWELIRRGKYGGYLDIYEFDNLDEDEVFIKILFKVEYYLLKVLFVIYFFYYNYFYNFI